MTSLFTLVIGLDQEDGERRDDRPEDQGEDQERAGEHRDRGALGHVRQHDPEGAFERLLHGEQQRGGGKQGLPDVPDLSDGGDADGAVVAASVKLAGAEKHMLATSRRSVIRGRFTGANVNRRDNLRIGSPVRAGEGAGEGRRGRRSGRRDILSR